jgi:hypothetical protein
VCVCVCVCVCVQAIGLEAGIAGEQREWAVCL